MVSLFSRMQKSYAEYEFWKTLNSSEKVNFLFDIYLAESYAHKQIDLSTFFESVREQFESERAESDVNDESYDFDPNDVDRVDVMIDDSNIMIESNNLKALRAVTYKFVESGYILKRDVLLEKLFRKDKLTRYLRIFKIINQAPDICSN